MKIIQLARAASLALACTIGSAWSGTLALADDQPAANAPAWLAGIADQKLFAVDGSSITLSPGDDKLALAMVSAGGAEQTKVFALMSDNLGTISDHADAAHVIGFFRVTDSGLEAQYADGHTESLTLNGAGGISLATHGSGSSCQSWYPPGHVFSEAERRAALADYASRLGLAQPVSAKAPHAASSCAMQAQKAATPSISGSRNAHHAMEAGSPDANNAGFAPIMVRTSVVHSVDGAVAAPMPPAPGPVWSMSAATQTSARQTTADPPAQAGLGASQCLSVESDGADLGFRNQCAYAVAFAYCLQSATEQAASCDIGTKTGSVAGNAFTPLLLDANIKSGDAEHDFRWVACSGGDVTAHLDRTDPPAGRCIRTKTS